MKQFYQTPNPVIACRRIILALLFMAGSFMGHAQILFVKDTTAHLNQMGEGAIVAADLDGDGIKDILQSGRLSYGPTWEQRTTIAWGQPGYHYPANEPIFDQTGTALVKAVDIDSDSDLDVILLGFEIYDLYEVSLAVRIYENLGGRNFAKRTDMGDLGASGPQGLYKGDMAFADVDGDGDQDLCIAGVDNYSNVPAVRILFNDGTGRFYIDEPFVGGWAWGNNARVCFGDIDNDGDPDLLVSAQNAYATGCSSCDEGIAEKMFLNDGTGNFTLLEGTPFVALEGGSVTMGDANGDTFLDVLITGDNPSSSSVTKLYFGDGAGNFTPASTSFPGISGDGKFIDVDNDGDLDVLLDTGAKYFYESHSAHGISYLYENDGTGAFTLVTTDQPFIGLVKGDQWYSHIAVEDLNEDGLMDVIVFGTHWGPWSEQANVYLNAYDTIAPVADAPTLPDIAAACEVASLTPPTATDNNDGSITGTTGTGLPITASTTITWTFTDNNGNTSTQTQNVIIADATAPVPDAATLPDITAECEVTSLTPPTATDACSGSISGTADATLPITTSTSITWTFTDNNGNASTQTQNVVITDAVAPVPDVATLPDVSDPCEVTSLTPPTATDNCAGTVTGTTTARLPIKATAKITWTFTDNNGNTSSQFQNVIIKDTKAPVPDAATLPDITAECAVTSLLPPTATDNCVGTIAGKPNISLPITASTTLTWTFTDNNHNTATQTQNVLITDSTVPEPDVATLPDIIAECEITSLTIPTATDNCAGTISGTYDVTLPITTQGTTVVTWTYDDDNGNTTTQTQNVVIDDVTAPVADVATLPDVTAECEVTSLTAPTATDNCAGTITGTYDVTLPITTQGTTVVTWRYDDGNGNTTTQTQNVIINDITAPVPDVTTLPDVTAECEVTSLTAPTATDNCAGTITGTYDVTLPITTQGTTVVTWTYDDDNGNTSTQTQNVVIDDVTAPVADVATLSDVTAECEVTSLTAPTATDNCAGTITGTYDVTLPITTQGTTVVTWTYDDGNGNTTTQTQNVIINDITAPVPDVTTLPDVTAECEVTSLTAPTATDNCAGTISGTYDVTHPITTQGTTVVTWTFDDGNGNTIIQTQNVVIDDVTAPVADVASLSDITAECEVTSLTAPTATDNCAGTISGTYDVILPISTQGTTVVTWTFDDGNGNTTTQTQNVVIDDVTAPVADVPTLPDVTTECEVTSLNAPTATDNCAGTISGTYDVTLPITTQGTTVVTWTFDDGNGNTTTQTQNIVIEDITSPEIVCAENQLVDVGENNVYVVQGTEFDPVAINDNCEVLSVVNNLNDSETLDGYELPEGTYEITWTVTDIAGNESTCTTEVTVSNTVGISDFEETKLLLYPNPTSGWVTLSIETDRLNAMQYLLTTAHGVVVQKGEIHSLLQKLDVSGYAPGVYLLVVKRGNMSLKTFQVIKM